MSRYYFHLWTGDEYQTDETGIDLKDSDEAYLEAYEGAWEISIDMLRQQRSAARYRFDVVDHNGRLIHALPFTEAMCRGSVNKPAFSFVASASRGYDLASDLVREMAKARQSLQACRQLLAISPGGGPLGAGSWGNARHSSKSTVLSHDRASGDD